MHTGLHFLVFCGWVNSAAVLPLHTNHQATLLHYTVLIGPNYVDLALHHTMTTSSAQERPFKLLLQHDKFVRSRPAKTTQLFDARLIHSSFALTANTWQGKRSISWLKFCSADSLRDLHGTYRFHTGAATTSAQRKVHDYVIQQAGRWRSQNYRAYIRHKEFHDLTFTKFLDRKVPSFHFKADSRLALEWDCSRRFEKPLRMPRRWHLFIYLFSAHCSA